MLSSMSSILRNGPSPAENYAYPFALGWNTVKISIKFICFLILCCLTDQCGCDNRVLRSPNCVNAYVIFYVQWYCIKHFGTVVFIF